MGSLLAAVLAAVILRLRNTVYKRMAAAEAADDGADPQPSR